MTHCMTPPVPFDEQARLEALAATVIINTPPDKALDTIVDLAAHFFSVPIALVSLVGYDKQILSTGRPRHL